MSDKEKEQNKHITEKQHGESMTGVIFSCLLIGLLFLGVIVLVIYTGARLNLWG